MYEYHNENSAYNLIYSECCKYKWTAVQWKKVNGKWIETDKYKRFNTLEEAKNYVIDKLNLTRQK